MKNIFLHFLILFYWSLTGQNLIPNPGFDILSQCPDGFGQINYAFPWREANNGTPDLYNECSTDNDLMVPGAGHFIDSYQKPRSGEGYSGIFVYSSASFSGYEYIETPLLSSLKKGEKYYVEFYVSPDLTPLSYWRYTDAIGLALSDTFYYKDLNPNEPLSLTPVIENRGTLIKDTVGWTRISGCFTAHGGENFAVIGNFRNYSETLIEVENPNIFPISNYFYLEDVSISLFDPLPDTIFICKNENKALNVSFLNASYLWNTGETDSVLIVNNPGEYVVNVILDNCILIDSVQVIVLDDLIDYHLDTLICQDELLKISSPIIGDYIWSTGSNEKAITVNSTGLYEVTTTNTCGQFVFDMNVIVDFCDCQIFIPNIISINNDGINDILNIAINCDYDYRILNFSIFNRWGCNIYSIHEGQEIAWNGTYKNEFVNSGVYVWALEYEVIRNNTKNKILKTGDITVLR
ncbi:MAG: gliding motility-associated C-terminal domain-containing protein [Saprospiraceae bacterium]